MTQNTPSAARSVQHSVVLGLAFTVALSILWVPTATAQDVLPRTCGFEFQERAEYCGLWGLIPSWEDCKCVPAQIIPEEILNLCSFTPEAAGEICKSRGMFFNSLECKCEALRLLPQVQVPEIPRHWWPEIPKGTATWRDGQILVHRGDGTFVATDVTALETAIELTLQGTSIEEIEAQGLSVVDADSF